MKTAALFHGTGSTGKKFWMGWLNRELSSSDYNVWAPNLPDTPYKVEGMDGFASVANLKKWRSIIDSDTPHRHYNLIVGHSAGCALILQLLTAGVVTADHIVLVAGYITPLPGHTKDNPSYPRDIDPEKVRSNSKRLTLFHSDNDPWGCDHHQGEALRQALGGHLIVMTGEGHFGSEAFGEPYKTFPLLKSVCMLME